MELEALVVPLILDSSKYVSNLNGAKTTTTQTTGTITGAFRTMGLGSVVSMLSVGAAAGGIVAGLKECIQSTLDYGTEVQKMSLLNGISAEEASRLIQLTGDYKISQGDLEVASRQLAKNGISLSVQALQDLSTEYNNIKDPADRTAWLMHTFGARGGDAFVTLMAAGAEKIGDQNAALDTNLILSEDQLVAQGKLKDSLYCIK